MIQNVNSLPCRFAKVNESKQNLIKYYKEHAERMYYMTYREIDLMIGSGPIESADRNVIQQLRYIIRTERVN